VSHTTQTSLCVEVARAQASTERGHAAQWTVSAWTTGGDVPDATIQLQATPASGGAPGFTFGCGNADGTSSCDLGTVDANSAPRQLQAEVTVPVTASTVTSVSLTVIGGTAHLAKYPEASATESITAPPSSATASQNAAPSQNAGAPQNPTPPQNAGAPQNAGTPQNPTPPQSLVPLQNPTPQNLPELPTVPEAVTSPLPATSPLPVGSLPSIPAVAPTLNPSGNAAGLFPTVNPTPDTGLAQSGHKAGTRPVADTSALPEGAPVVGAQLAGLAALALAFALAVTRLTIRRRPVPAKASPDTAAAATPPAETPSKEIPKEAKDTPGEPPAGQQEASETPPTDPPAASGEVTPDA
jgi:hypothetical protein